MDSPGLYDTGKSQEEIGILIMQAVAGMHPGPHAILYVVPMGRRYTAEEHGAYKRLKALFDDALTCYLIVVFTHVDALKGKPIEDMLGPNAPKELQEVLTECKNRYVAFNNMAADPRPQVENLFQMVRHMIAENGGQPYSCPKYVKIGQGMEAEVTRRLQEVEKLDLQRQNYVQELQQKTKEAEDTACKTQEQCQKNEEERQRRQQEEEQCRKVLEEKLQNKNQIGFEKYQQELQTARQKIEEQERQMKEKEAQMSENERKRDEKQAEIMKQQEQTMKDMMEEQQEQLQQQRKKDEERRQEIEREHQKMEDERRADREEMRKREEEKERMLEQKIEGVERAAIRRVKQIERPKREPFEMLKSECINGLVQFATWYAKSAITSLFMNGKVQAAAPFQCTMRNFGMTREEPNLSMTKEGQAAALHQFAMRNFGMTRRLPNFSMPWEGQAAALSIFKAKPQHD